MYITNDVLIAIKALANIPLEEIGEQNGTLADGPDDKAIYSIYAAKVKHKITVGDVKAARRALANVEKEIAKDMQKEVEITKEMEKYRCQDCRGRGYFIIFKDGSSILTEKHQCLRCYGTGIDTYKED